MDFSKPFLLGQETIQSDVILDGCAYLHAHCVQHDHTLATFLPPLTHSVLLDWWNERFSEVNDKTRHIVVQLLPVSSRTTSSPEPPTFTDVEITEPQTPTVTLPSISNKDKKIECEVAGVVMLSKPFSQTGPFRSILEKLFVSPYHRRKGISRMIVRKLEEAALQDGRWNILLDTTAGTEAEIVYPRLGYRRLCVVPEYGYSPKDGSFVDEVWFWKDLRKDPLC